MSTYEQYVDEYEEPAVPQKTKYGDVPSWTTYHKVKIPITASPRAFARKMAHHNRNTQFTSWLLIGQSGSGKTTIIENVIHEFHDVMSVEFGVQFSVMWLPEGSLQNIEQIFKTMPKRPTILIFDDVSNELESLAPTQRKQVFKALTTVRHDVGAPILCVSAIHYSKALDKALRNVSYVTLSSISDEDFSNLDQLWGYKQTDKLNQFFTKYEMMHEEDHFDLYIDNKPERYETGSKQNPDGLRVALSKRIKKVNFMVYGNVKCNLCAKFTQEKDEISADEFYKIFRDAYNTRCNNVMMYWLFSHGNPEALASDYHSAWNMLTKMFSKYKVNKNQLVEILKTNRGQNLKRLTRPKRKHKEAVDNVLATISTDFIRN